MPKLLHKPVKITIFALILTLLALFLFCSNYNILNKIPAFPASASPDVIAIRVIPNHQHYSPQRWYKEQGFAGSPQSLTINGYEAIKEGRTVYVNAANISNKGTPDPSDDILYTNIYLMSYNQDADSDTIAIVNQLLQHWHFNTDLQDVGKCVDAEGNLGDVCLIDPECPEGEYCSSAKANVTRDTKRLEDLAEIKIALKNYKNKHNRYPDLSSGSYLPNKTISTWPSWQDTLANELNITLPEDPINRLGDCGDDRFNPITCWDEQAKEFADSDLTDPALNLPVCSYVYVYTAKDNGSSYDVCAVMESGLITTLDQGACSGSELTAQYSGETANRTPQFIGANLPTGYSGEPYQGFVSAVDPDGDELTWTFNIVSCPLWNNLRMENTAVANQKTVLADNAGQAGNCSISITINDSRGGIISQNYTITVENGNLPIIQPIANQTITIGYDLSLTVLAEEADNQYPLTFIFSGKPIGFNSTGSIAGNQHDYHVSGVVVDQTKIYNVSVIAYDIYNGASDPVDFTVTVENQAPVINPPLTDDAVEACTSYSYSITANDPNAHDINYSSPGLPAGLALNKINANNAEITGIPTVTGSFSITINIADEYAVNTIAPYTAIDSDNFNLAITDEVFTVTAPANNSFYVAPTSVPIGDLYHFPVTYFGTSVKSTANSVVWTRATAPALPADMNITINPNDGAINASANNNTTNPGIYTVTVTATNDCGANHSDSFNLTVLSNEWCGDGIIQAIQGEQCEGTDLGGKDCTDYGFTGGTPGCLANCFFDISNCCNDGCAGRECGADPNNCWSGCPPGCGSHAHCTGAGQCVCDAGWSACDGSKIDADGCECYTGGSNVCWSGSCCTPTTCATLGMSCGTYNNDCGGTVDCGICTAANTHCLAGGCVCVAGWQDCDGNGSCECSGWCSGTSCCTSAAGVNIQVCADNEHKTYFNGGFISSAAAWWSVQSFNVNVVPGKNVIAIRARDWGGWWGVSATLNWPGCVNMTTAEVSKWKCTTSPGSGWTNINYDDSSWPTAVYGHPGSAGIRAGNYLTVPQIWASTGAGATVYCRYTFGE